jgi:hypothetical protein
VYVKDTTGTEILDTLTVFYPSPSSNICSLGIEINTAEPAMSSDLYHFPLLVRLDSTMFDFSSVNKIPSLRFVSETGAQLPHEIERWSSDLKRAEIWVQLDTLHASEKDTILLCIDTTAEDSSSGKVFSVEDGFAGVWHLNELTDVAVGVTENENDMRPEGGMDASDLVEGVIGYALDFDGSEYLIKDPPAVSLQFTSDFTISAWFKLLKVTDGRYSTIIGRQLGTDDENSWNLSIDRQTPTLYVSTGRVGDVSVDTGSWHYVTAIKQGRNLSIYINGEFAVQNRVSGELNESDSNEVTIGAQDNDGGISEFFNGSIDEVRVSDTACSSDWIKTSYLNQIQGSSMTSIYQIKD